MLIRERPSDRNLRVRAVAQCPQSGSRGIQHKALP